ncbi:cell division control protein 14, SIN component-domain-containing protein [Mycena filopes]|nr:cell division control protein 14, SIN component-domain-containing protein [Mycena filopes]
MLDRLTDLRRSLEDSLDDLSSPRTSNDTKTQALRGLEKLLAAAFVPKASTDELDYFLALQYTFECNVPSRILAWMASATSRLDLLTNKGTVDEAEPEVAILSSQLALALSIIQGVCLTHAPTKVYLGRRYALEVLLDLFLSSRHLSSTPFASAANASAANISSPSPSPVKLAPGAPLPLASVILDTLLCILVDSSPALRVFEACHGVHAVVKILKRAGTPREVRMKCLEFLYFYLLDETSSATHTPTPSTPTPTAPSTPMSKKPFINNTPARPMSRYGSSTFSSLTSGAFASTASSSSSSSSFSSGSGSGSRSTSGSSTSSFSSTSSNAGSRSPKKPPSQTQSLPNVLGPSTPRQLATPTPKRASSPKKQQQQQPLQPRALLMLRRDLDFVPLSPKVVAPGAGKANVNARGGKRAVVVGEDGVPLGQARRMGSGGNNARLVSTKSEEECDATGMGEKTESEGEGELEEEEERDGQGREQRTTDEKKKLLGTMLGNVEALVEGVRKAGIWGLG